MFLKLAREVGWVSGGTPSGSEDYLGVKVIDLLRRTYPEGTLAAHVLGHLGPADSGGQAFLLVGDSGGQAFLPVGRQTGMSALLNGRTQTGMSAPLGRMGVERQYEALLQGHPGVAIEQTDRGGRVLKSYCRQQPVAGRDVELTLDVRLQRTAEELLQSAWSGGAKKERRVRTIFPSQMTKAKRGQNYFSESNDKIVLTPFLRAGR